MNEVIVKYSDNGYGNVIGEMVGELVRCKECRHWNYSETSGKCIFRGYFVTCPDDFCSYGEREGE